MKRSTLIFRSLAVIIILAGLAQMFTYAANNREIDTQVVQNDMALELETSSAENKTEEKDKNTTKPLNNPEFLVGKWKVNYDAKEFKVAVIYRITKKGNNFIGSTYQYEDSEGFSERAEGTEVLKIKSFNGQKGVGIYSIEYEGEKYDIDCEIKKMDENTFKLSYDYYGYGDVETWKRQ